MVSGPQRRGAAREFQASRKGSVQLTPPSPLADRWVRTSRLHREAVRFVGESADQAQRGPFQTLDAGHHFVTALNREMDQRPADDRVASFKPVIEGVK